MILGSIGLTERDEEAYRALFSATARGERELAQQLGWTVPVTRRVLERLTEAGLARRTGESPATYAAVDPRLGLSALIRVRRSELDAAATAAAALGDEYQELLLRAVPSMLVEVIEGSAEIVARVSEMLALAQDEVVAFDTPPYVDEDGIASRDELELLARGVGIRAVYAAEVLERPRRLDVIKAVISAGEQARVAPRVPLKMLLVDGKSAVIPLTASSEGTRSTAVLVHRSRLCDALLELFEASWRQAVPIFGPPGPGGEQLSEEDCELLRLLAAGVKDEAVARQLGLSDRTLRRRISDLIDRLGATSRFQAGVQAVRRGWL